MQNPKTHSILFINFFFECFLSLHRKNSNKTTTNKLILNKSLRKKNSQKTKVMYNIQVWEYFEEEIKEFIGHNRVEYKTELNIQ